MTTCAIGLALLVTMGGDDAAAVLESKGLQRESTVWVLPAESELYHALRDVRGLDRDVRNARKESVRMERALEDLEHEIAALTQRRHSIAEQLPRLTAEQHNQAVVTLNQINVRLAELYEYKTASDEPAKVEQAMVAARQAYIRHVLAMRRIADAAIERYAELAADPEVTGALAELGRDGQRTFTLGPSRRFDNHVRRLDRLESAIETDRIAMRHDTGVWRVPVVFNREVTKEMIFDSGASMVTLPAQLAAEIGLTPGPDDPRARYRVADGSVVEATVMTIPLLRVGSFEVADVRCAVMPPGLPDAPALLGGSFINRFGYTIDTGAGTLTLHRLEDDAARK